MQSIYFFLSAALLLFSQKGDPSVYTAFSATKTLKSDIQNVDCQPFATHLSPPDAVENERPILLKSWDEIPVEAPSDAQKREADVLKIKKNVADWDAIKRSNAQHWQRQPLLHWNEFARELIAAHNVPPRVLPDSSGYPTPNRAHPADLPRFPFANPPYASRVLSYVSVAQYDALFAAQFYQTKFQKMAANPTDRVYPSAEAAVAAASAEVLKYMFPASVDDINEKLEFAQQSAYLSGKYTENDVKAGEKLGIAIAQKAIARAKTDGMETAQGAENQWQKIINRRTGEGQLTWVSKQKPARPTIEPFFGNVHPWWVTDVAKMRPAAPPATNSEALKKEIDIVKRYSRSQSKPRMDTIMKWSDAEFSSTPVGHWNLIASDLLRENKSSDAEIVRTLAVLNRGLMDAAIVCWEAKTFYCYPRPSQIDPTVTPRLPLPNFPSYPSGHSVFSATAATILGHFFPSETEKLNAMSENASISRLYAGLHFQMDCEAGTDLGKKVAALSLQKMKNEQ